MADMSTPLGASEKNQLLSIESELENYIKESARGEENKEKLFHIRDELQKLLRSTKIPPEVKQRLQQVLKEDLQPLAGTQPIDPKMVTDAKNKIHDIVQPEL